MSITKNTLLSQILQLIPRDLFYSEVGKHLVFEGFRILAPYGFYDLLPPGQGGEPWGTSNGLKSITGNAKHLGLKQTPAKSTLSYQNNFRSWTVFRDRYYALFRYHLNIHMGIPRK